VTKLAADPAVSATAEQARWLAATRGSAEDVLAYDPDLVLAGPFGASPTVQLLRRLKRNVLMVPLKEDLDGVRSTVRLVASAIGADERGEAMIAEFDARLAVSPLEGPAPTAIVYQVGGTVLGPGSLADAALAAAGFRNMAAAYRPTRSGEVPLELLLATPPDLIVLPSGEGDYRTVVADNLRHPALNELRRRRPVLELPSRYWLCANPHLADAIERLAAVRESVRASMRARSKAAR